MNAVGIPFLGGQFDDLPVHDHGFFFRLRIKFTEFLEAATDRDGRRFGGGCSAQVPEPFRDRLRVLHLGDGGLLELLLHSDPFDPHHLNVLPHVLDADLNLSCNSGIQQFLQFLAHLGK